jgi:hypothetical protein
MHTDSVVLGSTGWCCSPHRTLSAVAERQAKACPPPSRSLPLEEKLDTHADSDAQCGYHLVPDTGKLRYHLVPAQEDFVPSMKKTATSNPAPAADSAICERILGAAFRLFTTNGYAGTSTLDIATAAGMSKRALYSRAAPNACGCPPICPRRAQRRCSCPH